MLIAGLGGETIFFRVEGSGVPMGVLQRCVRAAWSQRWGLADTGPFITPPLHRSVSIQDSWRGRRRHRVSTAQSCFQSVANAEGAEHAAAG